MDKELITLTTMFTKENCRRVYVMSRDSLGLLVGKLENDAQTLFIIHLDEFERIYTSENDFILIS